ncbi:MAG: hypothetical protein HRT36_02235 [Alphaproteobacteria bacterium]|nr:hypothetical protein [Alphaproteobacteria bacterium]
MALIAYAGQFNSPVQIAWNGFLIELSLLTLGIVLVAILGIVLVVLLLIAKIRQAPRRFQEFRKHRRRESGYRALTRGMVAVAAGEKFAARKAARQAEDLLQDPPLTMLLSAQSAQLDGDELAAKRYFSKMLEHPEMAFLGWRGLIMRALRDGESDTARQLITQAEARFPKQPWLVSQALDFEQREGNVQKALTLVHRAQKTGALAPSEAKQREIMLLLMQARGLFEKGALSEAKNVIQRAWKLLKKQNGGADFSRLDGAYDIQWLIAEIALRLGDRHTAEAALRQCWQWRQGGEVLASLEELYRNEAGTALQAWKSFKQFFRELSLSSAAAVTLAKIALAAELIGEAEAMLARDSNPNNLAHYQLQAVIAESKGDADAVQQWQQKALNLEA